MKTKPYYRDLTPLPLRRFTFHRESKSLTAFASDFGPARDGQWWLQPLYTDAADVGIAILSDTTRTVRFVLAQEETQEGDVVAWHFTPLDPFAVPTVKKVTIWND